MKTYKSQSNIKPNELDINVDTVYHNYNMVEKTNENGILKLQYSGEFGYNIEDGMIIKKAE